MKKALTICLVIAAILIVAGGILIAFGIIGNGGIPALSEIGNYTEYTRNFSADTTEIRMDLKVNSLTVRKWDGEDIRIHYYEREGKPLTLTETNGAVSMIDPNRNYVGFWWGEASEEKLRVTVEVPEGFSGELKLATSTGDISVSGIVQPDRALTVTSSTGKIRIEDCRFREVTATSTTGNIEIESLICGSEQADVYGVLKVSSSTGGQEYTKVTAGETVLTATTGDIRTEDLSCTSFRASVSTGRQVHSRLNVTGDAEIKSTTGEIRTDDLTAGGALRITATTGSIRTFRTSAGTSLYLEATTGSVEGSLYNTSHYFAADCSSKTGSVQLPTFSAGGTVPLTVRTSTGSIHLTSAD